MLACKEKHIEKYKHNKEFIDKGIKNTDDFLDWYVVAIFYCSVHLMEAFLSQKNIHSENHGDRKDFLRKELDQDVFQDYLGLYNLSRKARYDCIDIGTKDAMFAQQYKDSIVSFCKEKEIC